MHYWSEALLKHTSANVILPEIEGPEGEGPFPVMYLLHGLSDDHSMWQRFTRIEHHMLRIPMIVVMPDGGRGFYCDSKEGYAYETSFIQDTVGYIDRVFNTKAERNGRVLAGLSMGGYGALKFALRFPDMFCSAVSHSGGVGFGHEPLLPHRIDEFTRLLGPEFVGGPNDLWALGKNVDRSLLPALRMDFGTEDFEFLVKWNRDLHAYWEEIGLPHEYEEFPGAHDWDYWDLHIQEAIAFHCKNLSISRVPRKS
jgi:S-formylglutathione hydrolase FrmB